MDSSGYKRIPKFSPQLTKYIIDNYEELSLHSTINKSLFHIKQEFEIAVLDIKIENSK